MYSLICSNDGIKAREIAREVGVSKTDINRVLYNAPFIHELCYRDSDYNWHGLIRQARPHTGLSDFCGYYGTVERFQKQDEESWLEELKDGCKAIGRNLNDTRGLIHSFKDARETMLVLFQDLEMPNASFWEICFELRIISFKASLFCSSSSDRKYLSFSFCDEKSGIIFQHHLPALIS